MRIYGGIRAELNSSSLDLSRGGDERPAVSKLYRSFGRKAHQNAGYPRYFIPEFQQDIQCISLVDTHDFHEVFSGWDAIMCPFDQNYGKLPRRSGPPVPCVALQYRRFGLNGTSHPGRPP